MDWLPKNYYVLLDKKTIYALSVHKCQNIEETALKFVITC